MATFKCKMYGGALEVAEKLTVCECEYCGTQQTLPKVQDDNAANLFNRANNLRYKSEFDKAQALYEKLVTNYPEDSESYWGLVLCKYGIEYVEDPATLKKIPTCHRTQLEPVQTDADYLAALEHADIMQRGIYEREATEIDRLQKDILAIVHNEKPFDVFICYKETDADGKRTQDSVIANDIYYQLTQEGFKVFYAAITLEDKLGQAYEPYIYAALHSAKVMLVLGTKPEYFDAVWVRNEWSRYLKIIRKDRSKLLIPCYRDMDPYELPEEFAHLQAQDMSKIGFINDVIRGIKKVISVDKTEPQTVKESVMQPSVSKNIENLIKRGNLALEDGKWDEANNYFEQVLDENVEEYRAYIGKLCAELHVHKYHELSTVQKDIPKFDNYKKACRFGGKEVEKRLYGYYQEGLYNYAINSMKKAYDISEIGRISKIFKSLGDYKDSNKKALECDSKVNQVKEEAIYKTAVLLSDSNSIDDLENAISNLKKIPEFKDSDRLIEKCTAKIQIIKDNEINMQNNKIEAADSDRKNKIRNLIILLIVLSAIALLPGGLSVKIILILVCVFIACSIIYSFIKG